MRGDKNSSKIAKPSHTLTPRIMLKFRQVHSMHTTLDSIGPSYVELLLHDRQATTRRMICLQSAG
jgi:hypothetical protein